MKLSVKCDFKLTEGGTLRGRWRVETVKEEHDQRDADMLRRAAGQQVRKAFI